MRKLFCAIFFLLVACQTSNDLSLTPVSQTIVDDQSVLELTLTPTFTVTAVPTIIPTVTQTPLPIVTPTETPSTAPSPTPLPQPFELAIMGELIAYPLPVARRGDTVVYIQDSQLIVANVADPASPTVTWESEFLGDVINATADNNYLYIWLGDEVQIWNMADPQEPMQIGTLPFETVQKGFRKEIIVDADTLYLVQVIREDAFLTAIDIALPESPKILGTSEFYLPAFHQYLIFGSLIFVVDNGKIDEYDISDPQRTQLLGQIIVPTNVKSSLSLQDDLLIVAAHSKFILLDTTSLPFPTQVSEYADWPINQMVISDRTAFLYSEICGWEPGDNGTVSGGCGYVIDVVDILNPAKLVSKGFVRLYLGENKAFVEKMVLLDNYLYFEFSNGNVYVVAINQFGQ
ncbi:MAG: hypothetical protein IPM53_16560 [Anaerolineaceae bacterium]|nr:hypothetical protein [Anaerolineaceae bacterium]